MAALVPEKIRNIALLGGPGAGKTTLADALLFLAGAVSRKGSVDQGTSVFDHEEEAKSRHHSVSLSVGHLTWRDTWINIVDTPGLLDFFGDAYAAVRVVDGVVLVLDATVGAEAMTERSLRLIRHHRLPCIAFINKADDERADLAKVLAQLEEHFHLTPLPLWVPIKGNGGTVVNLVTGHLEDRRTTAQVPEDLVPYRERIVEAVAETDDALLETYLDTGSLDEEAVVKGLRRLVSAPEKNLLVFAGSALKEWGLRALLDAIVDWVPPPTEQTISWIQDGQSSTLTPRLNGPGIALVFKVFADPYVGRISLFRVFSGTFSSDSTILNATVGGRERVGQLMVPQGKNYEPIGEAPIGSIALVGKLERTRAGHTITTEPIGGHLPPIEFPTGYMELAVYPKARGDEEKILSGIQRVAEEDPVFRWHRHPETGETIIVGMGDQHLEVMVEKLKRKFGAEVITTLPKIPYKETIRKPAEGEGRFVKQTGGRGQYGIARIRVEPLDPSVEFEFVNRITGGAIPARYIPSVEKGVREGKERGVLANYNLINIRVILYDGKYHEVDSSDYAFQMAGLLALRDAVEKAEPYLLEPIMRLEATVPEEFVGDVIGDINGKRGQVIGIEPEDGMRVISALVPMASLQRYAAELRSLTRGRGSYKIEFSHYQELPPHLSAQVIAEARSQKRDDKEKG
ncbi:MAG: elongation factor G [Armatimonadetes bacterium]|nr:elongation factor G [Armatimonadota bacterium]MDW8121168.1 elongation factor G [Armatimonadota bacterium]